MPQRKANVKSDRVKLDEILKSLFSTSEKILANFLNHMFGENFVHDSVEITSDTTDFPLEYFKFDMLKADLCLTASDSQNNKVKYHIEFQTLNDSMMAIRMFEYGFYKAKQVATNSQNTKILYFPKQLVIFVEEDNNIEDELKMKIIFPDLYRG